MAANLAALEFVALIEAVWLNMLTHTGKVEVYLWRPGDWPAIVACLGRPPP